jgi:hypothetical protein
MISKDRYTSLYVQLSRAGYKKLEPDMGVKKEVPQLFWQLIYLHQKELGYSDQELASLFCVSLEEFLKLKAFYAPINSSVLRVA